MALLQEPKTTPTEDVLRALEFKPGVPLSMVVSHDVIKVVAKAMDAQTPIELRAGEIYHDLMVDQILTVQEVTKSKAYFASVKMDNSIHRTHRFLSDAVNMVRLGRMVLLSGVSYAADDEA